MIQRPKEPLSLRDYMGVFWATKLLYLDSNNCRQCQKCKQWVVAIPLPKFNFFIPYKWQIKWNEYKYKFLFPEARCFCDNKKWIYRKR
jgi:hypothetical protein